jgi:hypothetical protein
VLIHPPKQRLAMFWLMHSTDATTFSITTLGIITLGVKKFMITTHVKSNLEE